MKKIRNSILPLIVLAIIIVASGSTKGSDPLGVDCKTRVIENKQHQSVNMFVTHGHCSTPFSGVVDELEISYPVREDLGNPLEELKISFEIDPNTFMRCNGGKIVDKFKSPDLFASDEQDKISFRSTDIYTMGMDWYQLDGIMTIKGVEREVKFFATGIRDPKKSMTDILVLQTKLNLPEWGIDYDQKGNGDLSTIANKWMYMNMKIELI